MTAIVTDAHYRMAVALIRDLTEAGVCVIVCEKDTVQTPVGFCCRGIARAVSLPEEGYEDALFDLCNSVLQDTGEKPALLPVGAATLAMLAENRERFSAVCGLAVSGPENLALLNDKRRAGSLAKHLGIPVPESFSREDGESDEAFFSRIQLPCIVKPACGEKFGLTAAKRYRIVKTEAELSDAFFQYTSLTGEAPIVQEYLPGGGFGCSVLAKDGTVYASICHKRIREWPVTGGPSSCCEAEDSPALLQAAQDIVQALRFTGLAMFEFKQDRLGRPRFLECNPRVWGTYPLTRAAGTNFSICWLHAALGDEIPAFVPAEKTRMVFFPSDLAATLGYLRRGKLKIVIGAVGDSLNPKVRNGLFERHDPKPGRMYLRNLRKRGGAV